MPEPKPHDEIPIYGWWMGHPIPDLARIPRERWEEVLRQTHPTVREHASRALDELKLVAEANVIGWRIRDEELARAKAARKVVAFPAPLPGAVVPKRTRYKQVNIRLPPARYEDLCEAASIIGMRPTALVRMLTIRGVTQILAEATARDAATRASGAP
jgi:hypothetical protein